MLKKIVLSIIFIFIFGANVSPAFANGKNDNPAYQNKIEKLQNDKKDGTGTPDSGDNKHPSGKDRSVEFGNSYPQGKSTSDPDDNGKGPDRSNGGPDKPGGSGGVDKEDQDGNNGCGNDDDFEDDNEGWCGQKPKKEKPPKEDDCEEEDDKNEDEDEGNGGGGAPKNPTNTDPSNPVPQPSEPNQSVNRVPVLAAVTELPETGSSGPNQINPVLIGLLAISLGLGMHLFVERQKARA